MTSKIIRHGNPVHVINHRSVAEILGVIRTLGALIGQQLWIIIRNWQSRQAG